MQKYLGVQIGYKAKLFAVKKYKKIKLIQITYYLMWNQGTV